MDQEETEITFETSYSPGDLSIYTGEGEYEVGAKILCESMKITPCEPEFLLVEVNDLYE